MVVRRDARRRSITSRARTCGGRCPSSTTAWSHVGRRGQARVRGRPGGRRRRSSSSSTRCSPRPAAGSAAPDRARRFGFLPSFWWQFLLAGAIAAVIALVMARWLARGMTQPLRDMAAAARRMETGRLLRAGPHDEPRRGRPARRRVQPDERRAREPRALPPRPRRQRLARAEDADHRDPRAPGEPARRRRAARTPRRCR